MEPIEWHNSLPLLSIVTQFCSPQSAAVLWEEALREDTKNDFDGY